MNKIFFELMNLFEVSPTIARKAICLLLLMLALAASACGMSYQLGTSAEMPYPYEYHIGEIINYTVSVGNAADKGDNFTVDVYDVLPNGTEFLLGKNISLGPGDTKLYNASYIVRSEDVKSDPFLGTVVSNNATIEIATKSGAKLNASSVEFSLIANSIGTGTNTTLVGSKDADLEDDSGVGAPSTNLKSGRDEDEEAARSSDGDGL